MTQPERKDVMERKRSNLGLFVYNKAEAGWPWKTGQWMLHPTIRDRYLGTLLKGWWKLGGGSINRRFEIEIAVGGEDNMLQAGIVVPFLFRWHVGVRLPRKVTDGWIYQRREWTVRVGYIGRWFELLLGHDESAADMRSYYLQQFKNGSYDGPWTRLALWPGIHLTFHPRPLDRLFGRVVCETTYGEWEPVEVPMPERSYRGRARREERVWKRPRWPWVKHRRTEWWVDMDEGVPHAGKGENSWDCGDDAVFGAGGPTKAEAIANVTKAAMRSRERYGEARRPASHE